jgi:hypothetical protein
MVLGVFLALLLPGTVQAQDGDGVIEGRVVNGTEGGGSVEGLEVTLESYVDGTQASVATAVTDAEGRFVFEGLATDPENDYRALVSYQETDYESDWVSFPEGESQVSLEVTVYETTTSDEAISVLAAHTVVNVDQGTLVIKEYFAFVNEGDRTYIGAMEVAEGKRATLSFNLPEGASQLQLGEGLMQCCVYGIDGGFVDTMPFLPGSRQVAYVYVVTYDSDTYTFTRGVSYPTRSYDLLVRGEDISIDSNRLSPAETLDIQGTLYAHSAGENLDRGEQVVALISGLPKGQSRAALLWVGVTLGVLAGGFGLLRVRRRGLAPEPVKAEVDPDEERRELLLEIARLDDEFEGGRMPEETYRVRRETAKARLVELSRWAAARR